MTKAEVLAARYRHHPDYKDLLQEARLAEAQGGGPMRIRGAMLDYLRSRSAVVRPPRGFDSMSVPLESAPEPVAHGESEERYVSRCTRNRPLSRRQLQILQLLNEGKARKEMAHVLGVSPKSIATHVSTLYRKLNCHNRVAAITEAMRMGLIPKPEPAMSAYERLEKRVEALEKVVSGLRSALSA